MAELAEFHFLRPWWLLGFVLLAWALYRLYIGRNTAGSWAAVCDPELLRLLLVDSAERRQRTKTTLVVATAGTLALLALAGPTWERLPQPTARDDVALVVALDLSRSMDVADLPPSRLERVRYRLVDLLDTRGVGFVALVAYAGRPFLVSPLTDDFATVVSQLQALDTTTMPAGGSRADLALSYAAELLQNADHETGQVLLVTDGLAQPAGARAHARKLAGQGYRVSVLGVGTLAGGPVPAADGGFIRDTADSIIISKLERELLQSLAATGDGVYWELGINDVTLGFTETGSAREETTQLATDRWQEYGPWLLLPLLLLCALAFRRGGVLVALVLGSTLSLLPGAAQAFSWADLWSRTDQQAERLFHSEQWPEAAKRFEAPLWRAAAHYRAQDYERALEALEHAEAGARTAYLRGNALAMLQRYAEAEAAYIEALDKAAEGTPLHADAQHNLEQVRKMQKEQNTNGEPGEGGEGESAEADASEPGAGEGGEPGEAAEANEGGGQAQSRNEAGESQTGKAEEFSGDSTTGDDDTSAGGYAAGEEENDSTANQEPGGDTDEGDRMQEPGMQKAQEQKDQAGEEGTEQARLAGDKEEEDTDTAALLEQREAAIQALRQRELDAATEAWLRGIHGNTKNYLRRKFHRQYQRMENKANETEAW